MARLQFTEISDWDSEFLRSRPEVIDLKLVGGVWLLPNANKYTRPEEGEEPPPILKKRIDSLTDNYEGEKSDNQVQNTEVAQA